MEIRIKSLKSSPKCYSWYPYIYYSWRIRYKSTLIPFAISVIFPCQWLPEYQFCSEEEKALWCILLIKLLLLLFLYKRGNLNPLAPLQRRAAGGKMQKKESSSIYLYFLKKDVSFLGYFWGLGWKAENKESENNGAKCSLPHLEFFSPSVEMNIIFFAS